MILLTVQQKDDKYCYGLHADHSMLWAKLVPNLTEKNVNWFMAGMKRPFSWDDFEVTVSGGTLIDKGTVVICNNSTACSEGAVELIVQYRPKASIRAQQRIDLFSEKNLRVSFNGKQGGRGNYLPRPGRPGRPGQKDLNGPVPEIVVQPLDAALFVQ